MKQRRQRARRGQSAATNPAIRDAMRRAVSDGSPAARDLAYSLAERQRDAQMTSARTSPGYADYVKSRRGVA